MIRLRAVWIPSAVVLLLCVAVRIHLLPVPLERDEGEYAYVAQRLLAGSAPYRDAYSLKMPGIHLVYAGILGVLGSSPSAIHLGLLLANLVSAGLLALWARKLGGVSMGYLAASAFLLLSVGRPVQGVFANAEHFVLPGVIAGWWLVHRGLGGSRRSLLAAGVALGAAVVVKQHAIALLGFALVWVFLASGSWRERGVRAGFVGAGAMLPGLALVAWLAARGSLQDAYFWSFAYATRYVASLPGELGWLYLKLRGGDVVVSSWPIFLVALVGLGSLGTKSARGVRAPLGWFLVGAGLAVVPGLYFRPHYFVLVLPAVALLFAWGTTRLAGASSLRAIAIPAVAFAVSVVLQRGFLLADPASALEACYGRDVFAESIPIADYVARNSDPDDSIAVFGSEPQICFYAQRRSSASTIYMYPLMETHDLVERMQQEMIDQVRADEPEYLIFVNTPTSWAATDDSDRRIMGWAQQYWRRHYRRVGLVEIPAQGPSRYFWDDAASQRLPQEDKWVGIFRRNRDG